MIRFRSRITLTVLAVGAATALPAAAAAHPAVTPASVAAHTERADAALDRAAAHFAAGRQVAGVRTLIAARSQTGKARAEAAKLIRTATTPAQRVGAAHALRIVATQQGEQSVAAIKMLAPASPAAERRISAGAIVDLRGRERALAILNRLTQNAPTQARPGLARAIASISLNRSDEVEAAAKAAGDDDVTPQSAARMAVVIDTNLRGQARAVATLTALREHLPPAARRGLDRALSAVQADRQASGEAIEGVAPGMPPAVRQRVEELIGRSLPAATPPVADEPPAPGSGQPEDVPAGPPSSVPPAGPKSR